MERKKICKITVGSHLYGTNGPNSDRDYYGVFLPSRDDLLGLKPYPSELSESVKISEGLRNTVGDVDCKYFSLAKFMKLAAEGQPGQLELLFARAEHHVMPPTAEWKTILAHRHLFLSKRAIIPFIGFAEAQVHKAIIKGENLDTIQRLIAWSETVPGKTLGLSIREHVQDSGGVGPIPFTIYRNESGADLIAIAGRAFDVATPVKRLVEALAQLEKRYGTRSRTAAVQGVDWKSIHHAVRLTLEAEELLTSGAVTLPFTGEQLVFLKKIKAGELLDLDWGLMLSERIARLDQLVETSSLPDKVDIDAIEALHREILGQHILPTSGPGGSFKMEG